MRNQWLMTVAMAAMGMLVIAGTSAAENIQLARMISPAAKTIAADRSAPVERAAQSQAPTTIGEETLRHLIATISPDDAVAANHTSLANKPTQTVKTKGAKHGKAKKKHLAHKPHTARPHGHRAHPEILGNAALAPAKLKPCHRKVSPTPAFLLDSHHVPADVGTQAPWQHRNLRFGPK